MNEARPLEPREYTADEIARLVRGTCERLLVECEQEMVAMHEDCAAPGPRNRLRRDPGRRRARVRVDRDGGTRRIGRELPTEAVDELPVERAIAGEQEHVAAMLADECPQLRARRRCLHREHHGGLGHVRGPRHVTLRDDDDVCTVGPRDTALELLRERREGRHGDDPR